MPVDAEQPVSDAEAMVRTVVADLERRFTGCDREHVERTVRKHVDTLFEHARIKMFVGILAERRALEDLRSERAA
jgi:hypothetical protein